jgi:signal transduction histidine kinase
VATDAIARAVDNLLRNAVEAAPAGTGVRVEVSAGNSGPGATAPLASITVIDEGPGVPGERAGELFEPFFTTKPEGTGLGLALSRAIAASHGGSLEYRHQGGQTHFVLRLPEQVQAGAAAADGE